MRQSTNYFFFFVLSVLFLGVLYTSVILPVHANSSTATIIGGAANGNIFGSVRLDELNITSTGVIRSSDGAGPSILTFTYPNLITHNSSWINALNTNINFSTTGRDIIYQTDGGVGNEGPNLMLRANDTDGVPSIQFLIRDGGGTWRLMSSIYNDASHTTFASWMAGNQTQFFTYSSINPNTVSRKMFLDSGDTAEAAFTMNTWFRTYSDDAVTETFAVNGQTGAIWTHGSITPPNNLTDIGSATKYFNAIYSYYSLHNILRPINGTAITIQDSSGNNRFAFNDLASGSTDWAFVPTTTLNGNLGVSGNRWKASFIQNLDVSNQIVLGSGGSIISGGGANPSIVTFTYPATITHNGTWAQNNFGNIGNDFGPTTNSLVATTFSGTVDIGGQFFETVGRIISNTETLSFWTNNAAAVDTQRLAITTGIDVATATWTSITHVDLVLGGAITWQDSGSVGANTMTLGTNSPAVTTSPATWIPLILANGTTVYVPAWK